LPGKKTKTPKQTGILSMLWRGVIVFLVLLIGLECMARLPFVQAKIPLRSLGFSNYLFEIKWAKLNEFVKQNGVPDAIIVGNSMVNTGIDPLVINQKMKELTGKSITIFNFGVEGLNLSAIDDLARLLIDTYNPKILIVGTDIRDYSLRMDQLPSDEFLQTSWLKYELGNFSILGWLVDHSAFLQYYLLGRNWFQSDFTDQLQTVFKRYKDTNTAGYELDRHVPTGDYQKPDPQNADDKVLLDLFKNYIIDPGRLGLLDSLVKMGKENGTSVIFIEMPLQKTMYQFFDHPKQTRADFLQHIRPIIQQAGSTLIETPIYGDIPNADWGNRTHLNLNGAPIFSQFLGEQLVKLPEIQVLMK
jgi:hypothetical protein